MSLQQTARLLFAWAILCSPAALAQTSAQSTMAMDATGTAHLQNLDIPFSNFASPEARRAFIRIFAGPKGASPPPESADIATRRAYYGRYNQVLVDRARQLFDVDIQPGETGGVKTELILPRAGILPRNRHRILINLHGGAFLWGEGSGGEIESIPVAAVGRIAVLTVGYREGPEFKFPAASVDVAAVYQALLKKYKPSNIGIYGCSAGGILTAEAVAWIHKEHLPRPGAIGTFCGSVSGFGGDSVQINFPLTASPPLSGATTGELTFSPYFSETSLKDPMVLPVNSEGILAQFPPTLLLAGSRDFAVSSLLNAQSALTRAGVQTELHLWDGMWHSFFIDPDLPESNEVYHVIVDFFDRWLGH